MCYWLILNKNSWKVKPPTVRPIIKSKLNVKEDVNIKLFSKLISYLKSTSVGYHPKKYKNLKHLCKKILMNNCCE